MSNLESTRNYRPGGFHPTHIGDVFHYGRYKVVHKLGHGALSTVWLVKDLTTLTYVSLKILAADASKWSGNPSSELAILQRLRRSVYGVGKDHVVRLLDHFVHVGPNGTHQCIVTELLGTSADGDSWIEEVYPPYGVLPPAIAKSIVKQVAQAVSFLHQNNIIHGDLHSKNVLLASHKLSSMRDEDVESELYFGKINKMDWTKFTGGKPSPHVPRYLVRRPVSVPVLRLCLSDPANICIKVCDFSESTLVTPPALQPKSLNMPFIFRAPEVILHNPGIPTFQSEIWALAILFHLYMCHEMLLFAGHSDCDAYPLDELLESMVLKLGKLPEPFWSSWSRRDQYFDEDGRQLREHRNTHTRFLPWKHPDITEEEHQAFEKLIRSMVRLNPAERPSIGDVMTSEWFVKYCSARDVQTVSP